MNSVKIRGLVMSYMENITAQVNFIQVAPLFLLGRRPEEEGHRIQWCQSSFHFR